MSDAACGPDRCSTRRPKDVALAGSRHGGDLHRHQRERHGGDFTATINWGDGTTTAGTVIGSNGSFTVAGGHTYADEGSDPLERDPHRHGGQHADVPLTARRGCRGRRADGARHQTINANAGPGLQRHGGDLHATPTRPTRRATSRRRSTGATGRPTAGTITDGNGTLTVTGTHTYAASGQERSR